MVEGLRMRVNGLRRVVAGWDKASVAWKKGARLRRRPLHHVALKARISDVTSKEISTNPNGSGHPNAPNAAPAEESYLPTTAVRDAIDGTLAPGWGKGNRGVVK
jgi:hypothetical protein